MTDNDVCLPGGEQKKRKEIGHVINNVINTSTLSASLFPSNITIRLIKTFSVSPDKIPTYNKFCEIARREAGSRGFSEVLLKAMDDYNKKHGLGNPQLTLLPYAKPDAPSPMRVLCAFINGATTEGRVHCTLTGGSWIQAINCYGCRHNQLRKKRDTFQK